MSSLAKMLIVAGMFVGAIFLMGMICFGSYVSAHNYGAEAEAQLQAAWDDSQNVLAQYGQKVQEMAQIPDMYRDDLLKVTSAAIQDRYGKNGSQAMFQFIKEHNPTIDSKMYTRIEDVIESGRNEFQNSQTRVIDIKRSYTTNLNYFWRGFWLHAAGYPKLDLNKFQVITTDRAAKAFSTGKEDGPIKLRGN